MSSKYISIELPIGMVHEKKKRKKFKICTLYASNYETYCDVGNDVTVEFEMIIYMNLYVVFKTQKQRLYQEVHEWNVDVLLVAISVATFIC